MIRQDVNRALSTKAGPSGDLILVFAHCAVLLCAAMGIDSAGQDEARL